MAINMIDIAIILIFALILIVRETIPVVRGKGIKDLKLMVFVLTFFRLVWYAAPLYVANIAFVQFTVNVLGGHPFVSAHSLFTDILRFSITFGLFGLARKIYPRLLSEYLIDPAFPALANKPKSPSDTTFLYLYEETVNKPLLFAALYVCILLAAAIPFGLYAVFIQCPPGSACWPF